jgi:hypothetical protein
MAHPTITLLYNSTANDQLYNFSFGGNSDGTFYPVIAVSGTATGSGTIVFTGGGIDDIYNGAPRGSRSATIRPETGSTVVPKTFIEQEVLHQIPLAGPLDKRYVFAVHVDGTTTSELYLEAWDNVYHVTCNSPVLSGTNSNGNVSMIRAITTTSGYPGTTWSGTPLKGYESRIGLYGNQWGFTDEVLYFNIYVKIPYDCDTFVNTPVLSLRYLYS